MLRLKRWVAVDCGDALAGSLGLLWLESRRDDCNAVGDREGAKRDGGYQERNERFYLVNRRPRLGYHHATECRCHYSNQQQEYSHKKTVTRNADSVYANAREFSRTQKTAGVACN